MSSGAGLFILGEPVARPVVGRDWATEADLYVCELVRPGLPQWELVLPAARCAELGLDVAGLGRDVRVLVHVPARYYTDFASVPRWLWWLLPPTDPRYADVALAHDRAYECHCLTRAEADALLRDLARLGTVGRWVLWAGVRVGGRRSYRTGPARQRARIAAARRAGLA